MTTEATESKSARFALDETRAQAWLTQSLEDYEGERDAQYQTIDTLELSDAYTPLEDYEAGSSTCALVYVARQAAVITGPGDLEFDFCNSGDGEIGYTWLLYIGGLKVASSYEELRKCGDRHAEPGIPAALEVLREAVWAGNALLDNLARYVSAAKATAPDPGRCTYDDNCPVHDNAAHSGKA